LNTTAYISFELDIFQWK